MRSLFPRWIRSVVLKRTLFFANIAALYMPPAQATHNRAGEIIYQHVQGFTYKVTIITYTKQSSVSADRDSLEINWGDGRSDTLPRVNGNGNGVPLGNDIKYNEYVGYHTYPALGTYVISVTDPNRIAGIININGGNSVNEPFYIEDTLQILDPAFYGYNNSPILLNPPIDFANINVPFIHNPNAYDPDGDSLSFSFIVPRKAPNVAVANYLDPHLLPGTPSDKTFTIDPYTGEVVWDAPYYSGTYNFAILIREYRNGLCIGTMVRDMQVIVDNVNNLPPVVVRPNDTCVVAGTTLTITVTATDPNSGQKVILTSNGGPYEVPVSPATFTAISGTQEATGFFEWKTDCSHIRPQFYQVIFKATDNYFFPLADLKNWLIQVVGPAPENVQAIAEDNQIRISWQAPYACAATSRFIGFSVWRREGSNPFVPGQCETGLSGKGYEKIAEYLTNYEFIDQNVIRGRQYCYRILAEFADKALSQNIPIYYNNVYSLPSAEACVQLRKSVPVITQASVVVTDGQNGKIRIGWSPPLAAELDTVQNPPPYRYVFWRSLTGGGFDRLDSISAPAFYLLTDSVYDDSGLNTVAQGYTYKIGFYSGQNFIGESEPAATLFLVPVGKDGRVELSWSVNVPWTNQYYVVYRKNSSGNFDSIGTSLTPFYVDDSLPNDVAQCYLVKSVGSYSASGLPKPLINFSQEACAVPVDSVAPCPPVLEVYNSCNSADFPYDDFVNELIWEPGGAECAADVVAYVVYYAPNPQLPLVPLDTVPAGLSLSYLHQLETGVAACYALTAVDDKGNVSGFSNRVCTENCPFYELPNVFTPNNDGHNDTYHPFLPYRFVDRVDMKIFDQWGTLVYDTTDPMIRWDGRNSRTGSVLPEAVYYYVCEVYSNNRRVGDTRSGYIHLFR
ncbi:MAG: gliding motility-associated C-terminal domain-containing protein [Chitinophagales bacterium]|nr:gliding motility-associated C-terminal domain-containing protein [Chitinophagales bacterium]MDW8393710.1 gliding motility-associated C-terminal domain-containing protein [Chitinophagales bacterium]